MQRAYPLLPAIPPFLAMGPHRTPEEVVRDRVETWVDTWSSEAIGADMEALRPLMCTGKLTMMSDFGSDMAVSQSFEDYQALWMPILSDTFRNWQVTLASDVDIHASSSLAAASYFTVFEGETHQATGMVQRQAVSSVWKVHDCEWRLVQEHTSVDSEGRMA